VVLSLIFTELMDPWGCIVETSDVVSKFEDDFNTRQESDKLADSAEYLAILGNYYTRSLFHNTRISSV
jgi:hypothetical protein